MDSLVAFYEANPAFFCCEFVPNYITPLIITANLRASSRLFARAIALERICRVAVESGNMLLARELCESKIIAPGYVARLMFNIAARDKESQYADDACAIAYENAKSTPFGAYVWLDKAFTHLAKMPRLFINSAMASFSVRKYWGPLRNDLSGPLQGLIFNEKRDAIDLYSLFLSHIVRKYEIMDVLCSAIINRGPYAFDIWNALRVAIAYRDVHISQEDWHSLRMQALQNEGPYALAIYDDINVHITCSSSLFEMDNRPYNVLFNGGPHACQLFSRVANFIRDPMIVSLCIRNVRFEMFCLCYSKFPDVFTLEHAILNFGPDAPKICAFLLERGIQHEEKLDALMSIMEHKNPHKLEILDLILASMSKKQPITFSQYALFQIASSDGENSAKVIKRVSEMVREKIDYDNILRAGLSARKNWRAICEFAIQMGASDVRGALLYHHGIDLFKKRSVSDFCEWLLARGATADDLLRAATESYSYLGDDFSYMEIVHIARAHGATEPCPRFRLFPSLIFLNIFLLVQPMNSLVDFYRENPTFFRDIFIPEYLKSSYLTIGLRATCRTFAQILARPPRSDSIFIAQMAVSRSGISCVINIRPRATSS